MSLAHISSGAHYDLVLASHSALRIGEETCNVTTISIDRDLKNAIRLTINFKEGEPLQKVLARFRVEGTFRERWSPEMREREICETLVAARERLQSMIEIRKQRRAALK